MAVNKIVDTFSFGTIQTEIALRVLAPRIISVLPPLIEVKHERINNSSNGPTLLFLPLPLNQQRRIFS